ncbi:ABC transporter [uncultured archaeon]|nr:ABC transporter [uncultured archaeon]
MSLLEMKNITYRIKEREIFSGLSLAVEEGEVHAILGKNGTGKSTLAYLVMGCENYTHLSKMIENSLSIAAVRVSLTNG